MIVGDFTTTTSVAASDGGVPGCTPCYGGLIFSDGRRRCLNHATEDDVELVDKLDARAPGVGLVRPRGARGSWGPSYAWPYGPNVDVAARGRMLDWAETNGLRRSARGHACTVWLKTGERCYSRCRRRPELSPENPRAWAAPPRWMDHVSTWTRDGAPAVIVSQPYKIEPDAAEQLQQLAEDAELRLELLEPGASWYGHGTWFVGLWRVGA